MANSNEMMINKEALSVAIKFVFLSYQSSPMDRIYIKGFKSIKELELPLRPINILIGANGSGKSNFLSFFEFLQQIYHKNLQGYIALNGGIEKFLYNGSKITQKILGKLRFPNNS